MRLRVRKSIWRNNKQKKLDKEDIAEQTFARRKQGYYFLNGKVVIILAYSPSKLWTFIIYQNNRERALSNVIIKQEAVTLALASRAASASVAIALCRWTGRRTSLTSTRSTFTPQGSVASSSTLCISWDIASLSAKICERFLVPRTLRSVVAASNRVEWLKQLIFNFEEIYDYSSKWKPRFCNI